MHFSKLLLREKGLIEVSNKSKAMRKFMIVSAVTVATVDALHLQASVKSMNELSAERDHSFAAIKAQSSKQFKTD
jgi:hypothetical protein